MVHVGVVLEETIKICCNGTGFCILQKSAGVYGHVVEIRLIATESL